MNVRNKAKEVIIKFITIPKNYIGSMSKPDRFDLAMVLALQHVDSLISVTHYDDYPRKKTEMDREFWEGVRNELNELTFANINVSVYK